MSPSAVQAPASPQQEQKQQAASQHCWDSRRLQAAARRVAQAAEEPCPAGMQPPEWLAQGSYSWSCACCRPQSPKLSRP